MAAEAQRVRFHRAAEREMDDATRRYEKDERGLGDAFLASVRAGVELVAANPDRWPAWPPGGRHRRLVLHRFPFSLFYRFTAAEIYIVAVAHQKRRPGYWSRRG